MNISKIGEFGLIERFKKSIKTDQSVVLGSGDDCAILKLDKLNYQLFTCDMLTEGVDFNLKNNPYFIGRKAIAVSISDIISCSGSPRHCVISVGLPKNTSIKFVDKLFKGMLDLAKFYKINIVGGDLSLSSKLTIDVSMLGVVKKKYLTLRSQAKVGDIIFVTGELGGSIKGKHFNFIPRVIESGYLRRNLKVNAMIDISDGLASDLSHILKSSNVGAVIYEQLIPLSKDALNVNSALNDGEDFELLFTLSRKEASKLLNKRIVNFKPIGQIVKKSVGFKLVTDNYKITDLKPNGFKHF